MNRIKLTISTLVMIGQLFLASAVLTGFTPQPAAAAGQNGHGIVYNRSDCGYPNVRFYGNGGDWSGSTCDGWLDGMQAKCVWAGDYSNYNWDTNTLYAIGNYNRQLMDVQSQFTDLGKNTRALCAGINMEGSVEQVKADYEGNTLNIETDVRDLALAIIDVITTVLEAL